MASVLVIQHTPVETAGLIGDALQSCGVSARAFHPYAGESIPNVLDDWAGLVIMGGPMGVYDQCRYPFLLEEMRLLESALKGGKPLLGVCLGSQMLAAVLGADVTRGERAEIGWHAVTLTKAGAADRLWAGVERSFVAYHWHGDVIGHLPNGAVCLASSGLTTCQAFRYGSDAYGFLFHMEVTEAIIREMVRAFGNELGDAGMEEGQVTGRIGDHLASLQSIGSTVFHRWALTVGE